MESLVLSLVSILLSLGFAINCVTKFIKELKSSTKKSCKFKNGFEAKISVAPITTKKEVCATNTTPSNLPTIEKRA